MSVSIKKKFNFNVKLNTMRTNNVVISDCFEKLHELRGRDNIYIEFVRVINKMIIEINSIINSNTDDEEIKRKARSVIFSLNDTLENEIESIRYWQEKLRGRRVLAFHRNEYFEAIEKAYAKVDFDLTFL